MTVAIPSDVDNDLPNDRTSWSRYTSPVSTVSLTSDRLQSACAVPSQLGFDNDFVNARCPTPTNLTSNTFPLLDSDCLTPWAPPHTNPTSPVPCWLLPSCTSTPTPVNSRPQSACQCVDPSQLGSNNFQGDTNLFNHTPSRPALSLSPPRDLQSQPPCRTRQCRPPTIEAAEGEVLLMPSHTNKERNSGAMPRKKSTRKKWGYRLKPCLSPSEQVDGIIAELAAAHWESSTHNVEMWVSNVRQLIGDPQTDMFQDQSLRSVVLRCTRLQALDVRVNFLCMINLIQLVCKCQR